MSWDSWGVEMSIDQVCTGFFFVIRFIVLRIVYMLHVLLDACIIIIRVVEHSVTVLNLAGTRSLRLGLCRKWWGGASDIYAR